MSSPGRMIRLHRWAFLLAVLPFSAGRDTIAPGETVGDAGSLVSADGSFKLGFFTPGSSKYRYLGIWYNKVSLQTVVWVANRDRPLHDTTGVLSISGNGSLTLSDAKGEVYWSTPAAGLTNPVAKLQNDANFVVAAGAGGGDPAWESFDYPTDSLLPGMKLGLDLRTGRSRNITSWRSADDPASGEYTMSMDVHGDPQVILLRGKEKLWRTGPWVGQRFSGMPEMKTNDMFSFRFYNGADQIYYQFNITNSSVLSRLVVQPTGVVQRVVWIERAGAWNILWFAPKDQCDDVSRCGPFGVCDTNDYPICSCLQGFEPRSPGDWYLRDGRDGCVRRTGLDCRNGTDGFALLAGAKLPDTSAAVVNASMGLEECRAACLRNCSCTAYANANGCILWSSDLTDLRLYTNGGQDLYFRLAAPDLGTSLSLARKKWVATVAGVVVAVCVLLLGWVGYCTWKKKKKRRDRIIVQLGTNNNMSDRTADELPLLDFSTIAAATDGFSTENKLGEGGFGPVYKGWLGEGQEVAVKRLARNSVQGLDEFKNEVMLIAKLQHRNLVRLLGSCIEGEERMLVYEYMPNKSLDAFLFDKTKGQLLDWKMRYHIISGIARGLLYLHQDSRFRIIHRDLKASNVLLDKEMNPKISDFGMARIFGGDETEANTRRVVGT